MGGNVKTKNASKKRFVDSPAYTLYSHIIPMSCAKTHLLKKNQFVMTTTTSSTYRQVPCLHITARRTRFSVVFCHKKTRNIDTRLVYRATLYEYYRCCCWFVWRATAGGRRRRRSVWLTSIWSHMLNRCRGRRRMPP